MHYEIRQPRGGAPAALSFQVLLSIFTAMSSNFGSRLYKDTMLDISRCTSKNLDVFVNPCSHGTGITFSSRIRGVYIKCICKCVWCDTEHSQKLACVWLHGRDELGQPALLYQHRRGVCCGRLPLAHVTMSRLQAHHGVLRRYGVDTYAHNIQIRRYMLLQPMCSRLL